MSGIIVPACEERRFIDWCGDDSIDVAVQRELDRPLDCESTQSPGGGRISIGTPVSNEFVDFDSAAARADDYKIRAPANPRISERFGNYFRTDAARITRGDSEPHGHSL
jgi:hypothetical protein